MSNFEQYIPTFTMPDWVNEKTKLNADNMNKLNRGIRNVENWLHDKLYLDIKTLENGIGTLATDVSQYNDRISKVEKSTSSFSSIYTDTGIVYDFTSNIDTSFKITDYVKIDANGNVEIVGDIISQSHLFCADNYEDDISNTAVVNIAYLNRQLEPLNEKLEVCVTSDDLTNYATVEYVNEAVSGASGLNDIYTNTGINYASNDAILISNSGTGNFNIGSSSSPITMICSQYAAAQCLTPISSMKSDSYVGFELAPYASMGTAELLIVPVTGGSRYGKITGDSEGLQIQSLGKVGSSFSSLKFNTHIGSTNANLIWSGNADENNFKLYSDDANLTSQLGTPEFPWHTIYTGRTVNPGTNTLSGPMIVENKCCNINYDYYELLGKYRVHGDLLLLVGQATVSPASTEEDEEVGELVLPVEASTSLGLHIHPDYDSYGNLCPTIEPAMYSSGDYSDNKYVHGAFLGSLKRPWEKVCTQSMSFITLGGSSNSYAGTVRSFNNSLYIEGEDGNVWCASNFLPSLGPYATNMPTLGNSDNTWSIAYIDKLRLTPPGDNSGVDYTALSAVESTTSTATHLGIQCHTRFLPSFSDESTGVTQFLGDTNRPWYTLYATKCIASEFHMGKSTDSAHLDAAGNAKFKYEEGDGFNSITVCTRFRPDGNNTQYCGDTERRWGNIYTMKIDSTNGMTQSSDRNLKDSIKYITSLENTPMTLSLEDEVTNNTNNITTEDIIDFVRNIQPATFCYKASYDVEATEENSEQEAIQIGLIAQDIQDHKLYKYIGIDEIIDTEIEPEEEDEEGEVISSAVVEQKEILSLKVLPVAVTALTACKYLLEKIDTLEARLSELESNK